MEWIDVEIELPDDRIKVEVRDAAGKTAMAYPCFYHFRIINMEVVPVPRYFGGWMVLCVGIDCPDIGDITHWRKPEKNF